MKMEIIRFLKWWWYKLDTAQRVLVSIISWILFIGINTYFTSFLAAIATFFAGLGIAGAAYLIYQLYRSVLGQWTSYKEHKEMEAVRIVNKLRGAR
jgi:threonine/homoserine/homoserine lactone efflux protein